MGSWSENCGFSGIEIGEREVAYVMMLGAPEYPDDPLHGPYTHFVPRTTLIRGTYNDYGYLGIEDDEGVIAVFNKQSDLELKNGDDFNGDLPPGVKRFWVHGSIFEGLGEIKQDYPYFSQRKGGYKSTKVKNIGESAAMRLTEIREAFTEAVAKHKEQEAGLLAHPASAELITAIRAMDKYSMSDVFCYGERVPDYNVEFCSAVLTDADIEPLLEAYRRNWVLEYAANELRKKIVPSEYGGPQWGGEAASVQFARQIVKIQAERKRNAP